MLTFLNAIFFAGSGASMPLWDFVGSTLVTNNYVRLTSDHQSRQGGIWNTQVGYTTSITTIRVYEYTG